MTYLLFALVASALGVAAMAFSVALGRRNARTRQLRRTWEAYARTAHDPGEPLPPTRHARMVRMPDVAQ